MRRIIEFEVGHRASQSIVIFMLSNNEALVGNYLFIETTLRNRSEGECAVRSREGCQTRFMR